jgi:hypothetical protein
VTGAVDRVLQALAARGSTPRAPGLYPFILMLGPYINLTAPPRGGTMTPTQTPAEAPPQPLDRPFDQRVFEEWCDRRNMEDSRRYVVAEVEVAEREPYVLPIRTVDDLANENPQPPPMIIDPFLRRGQTMILGGEPGSGKTFMALLLLWAAATGNRWLGTFDLGTMRGGGLFLESPRWELWQRFRSIAGDGAIEWFREVPVISRDEARSLDICDARIRAGVIQWIRGSGVNLAVIDPFERTHPGKTDRVDVDMTFVVDAVEEIAVETGAAILLLHHLRKPSMGRVESVLHGLRGSTVISGAFDCVCGIAERQGTLAFDFGKVRSGPTPPRVWLARSSSGLLLPAAAPIDQTEARRLRREAIVAVIEAASTPLTAEAVHRGLGTTVKVRTVAADLHDLAVEKRVTHGKSGSEALQTESSAPRLHLQS